MYKVNMVENIISHMSLTATFELYHGIQFDMLRLWHFYCGKK